MFVSLTSVAESDCRRVYWITRSLVVCRFRLASPVQVQSSDKVFRNVFTNANRYERWFLENLLIIFRGKFIEVSETEWIIRYSSFNSFSIHSLITSDRRLCLRDKHLCFSNFRRQKRLSAGILDYEISRSLQVPPRIWVVTTICDYQKNSAILSY